MVEWKSTVKFLFLDYYTTTYWNLQSGAGVQNQCEALYIIKTQFCISSIPQELHIINFAMDKKIKDFFRSP